jgi:Anthrone oxygenase
MTAFWMTAVLALTAVVAGVMLGATVTSEPLLGMLQPEAYVRAKQFVESRVDPLMPILVVISAVAEVVSAVLAPRTAVRVPAILACLATVAIVVISQRVNVPINRWVARLDPGSLPPDFAQRDPRRRWRHAHLARTVLALAAVLANLVAAAKLTP